MALFSVVIPVYNVEKYICECIDSVISQSLNNYEVILVDDGSTDNSGRICDQYADKNCMIQVIHQVNKGLSEARNAGIARASGKYIVLLDSDDYLVPNALENFSKIISEHEVDIIAGSVIRYYESDHSTRPEFNSREKFCDVMTGREFMEDGLHYRAWEAPAQFNVYKRSFLEKLRIKFKPGILHEDELWTPQVFLQAHTVAKMDEAFYIYRIREGSITTSKKPKKKNAEDLHYSCYELENIAKKYKRNEVKWFRNHLATVYMSATYLGRLDLQNKSSISRIFAIRNACTFKDYIKSVIFMVSPSLYCNLDVYMKKSR